jgi:predicted DsbA family dithiol-disulfide isomerase
MRIEIVADVICPWCFVGKRRFERAMALRPNLSVARAWRPFQLNPETPVEGLPRDIYLQAKFGAARNAARVHAALETAGTGEGIDFAFDRIRRTPNTVRAHRMIRLAAAAGAADELVEALFCGYFLSGLDIGDIDVLAALAVGVGLDEDATRAYLTGDSGTDEVLAEDRRARRLGIRAVPCIIFESGYAIAGAQEPEMFLPLFDLAAATAERAAAEA